MGYLSFAITGFITQRDEARLEILKLEKEKELSDLRSKLNASSISPTPVPAALSPTPNSQPVENLVPPKIAMHPSIPKTSLKGTSVLKSTRARGGTLSKRSPVIPALAQPTKVVGVHPEPTEPIPYTIPMSSKEEAARIVRPIAEITFKSELTDNTNGVKPEVRASQSGFLNNVAKPTDWNSALLSVGPVYPPMVLTRVEPEYTDEARKARFQGTVVLEAILREDGSADDIRVIRSLGFGLDESAISAIKQWRFKPAMRGGKPFPLLLKIEFNFQLR
jgi:TonB family protein